MLSELYQELILDHNKKPRNRRPMANANSEADGHNPLCGDQVHVFVHVEGDRIADVSFEGQGCAISTASASMMTEAVMGRTIEEAEAIFRDFQTMVTTDGSGIEFTDSLEKLEALGGVREFPMRVKCATLAWHTLHAALEGRDKVSTE